MSLYAQHGYGKSTKIEKGIDANILSGIILSPKAEKPEKIKEFINHTKHNHPDIDIMFDPQFYICGFSGDLSDGKLSEYPYYISELSRANLSVPKNIQKYAKDVIDFQNELNVSKIVSPTILIDDFNGKQSQIAISLAYESISLLDAENRLMISLCINENAFKNLDAMNEFLDIISLLDVKGFYLIIDRSNNIKEPLIDLNILTNIMKFCYVLATVNEFEVILGYTDLLSIPLITTGISATACGWHNGQKMFSEANFQRSNGGRRARKRYTSNQLMNSILIIPEMTTVNDFGKLKDIMSATIYDKILLTSPGDSAWSDEISCLHNWSSLKILIDEIKSYETIGERLDCVTEKIVFANKLYRMFSDKVPFEPKSNNSHLNVWLAAISEFRNQIGE